LNGDVFCCCCFLVVFSSQSSGLQSVVFISLLFLRLVAFSPLGDHILTAVTNIATKTVLDFFSSTWGDYQ